MNPTVARKVLSKRDKEARDVHADIHQYWATDPLVQSDIASVSEFAEGSGALDMAMVIRLEGICASAAAHVTSAHYTQNYTARHVSFLANATHSFLMAHLTLSRLRAGRQKNAMISFSKLAHNTAQLHAIGWHEEAAWLAEAVWANAANTLGQNGDVPQIMPNELFGWFMSYFTLGNRDLIAASGVTEPDDPDTPFSHLLGRWREPDAAGLTNLMTAYAEQNMARSMLPFANAPADSIEKLWWYVPYDIYAIQQRRVSEGLDPVPLDDPRADIPLPDFVDAPLIQDDLIWPAYLRACAEDGITPYAPRKAVQAVTDRATLEVTLV